MNKLIIIGNLTRDPEVRYTSDGKKVATFTVAVNRRKQKDHPEADYFRVSAWDGLAEVCGKWLTKGKKVCVIGPVRCRVFEGQDGGAKAALEVTAYELELLSPKEQNVDSQTGYQQAGDEEWPF
ncbi:MAG: single-stranded DNA-binding protein [Clostridia bacterium]|nr:single-stranded DNA-binding protein [Clostridia bacterium]